MKMCVCVCVCVCNEKGVSARRLLQYVQLPEKLLTIFRGIVIIFCSISD